MYVLSWHFVPQGLTRNSGRLLTTQSIAALGDKAKQEIFANVRLSDDSEDPKCNGPASRIRLWSLEMDCGNEFAEFVRERFRWYQIKSSAVAFWWEPETHGNVIHPMVLSLSCCSYILTRTGMYSLSPTDFPSGWTRLMRSLAIGCITLA